MQLHIFVMSGSESGRSDPISGYSAEHSQVTASLAFIVTTAEKTTTYKSSIRRLWAPTWDFFCSVSLFFWQCHLMSFVLRFILFFSSFCFFDSFYGGDIWHLQLLNSRCREEWIDEWTLNKVVRERKRRLTAIIQYHISRICCAKRKDKLHMISYTCTAKRSLKK